jgi:hypothetical protein
MFPGGVLSIDYMHRSLGFIENEILIGSKATMSGSEISPYNITFSTNQFILSIDNGPDQIFNLPVGNSIVIDDIVELINDTAVDFIASSENNKLNITTIGSGPDRTIIIKNGSVNSTLGFEFNQSSIGSGALGGERDFDVKNTPLKIEGFTAPEDGDTIIIKNNDVTSRYMKNSVIKLASDYYQIENSILENKANLISQISGPFVIFEETNDTFKFTKDGGSEITVTLTQDNEKTAQKVVSEINAVSPDTAFLVRINNVDRIQLKSDISIKIGDGTANRSLGFDKDQEDDNTPDTLIQITGTFSTTYIDPEMSTSVDPVVFNVEENFISDVPPNATFLVIDGDQTEKYIANTLIKINNLNFHLVSSSEFAQGVTVITLNSPLTIAIFEDTLIEYTSEPIFDEGDVDLATRKIPILTEAFILRKNNVVLIQDQDYEITDFGDIELSEGLLNGDKIIMDYTGRRFIDSSTNVLATYTYFDFIRIGSNIKISYQARNPDNFFVNVLHGTTIMDELQDLLELQNQLTANSSSSGFPDGVIPVIENDDGGGESFYTRVGNIEDNINASQIIYDWYDNRLLYFETERELISGYIVGAEDGRITQSDITDAVESSSSRLFPVPDSRPDAERAEPLRVPALDGLNQNDAGDNTLGTASTTMLTVLNAEKTELNNESSKLSTLSGYSTTTATLSSGVVSVAPTVNLILYVEIENPANTLVQNNVTVVFSGSSTVATIVNDINTAVNAAFGVAVNLASSGGSVVNLNASSASFAKCVYVVQDVPELAFGVDNQASLRSRHTLWTGGYTYTLTVPGADSVHLDITDQNTERSTSVSQHGTQVTQLLGQMEEWVDPFDDAFNNAKVEKLKSTLFSAATTSFISDSNTFDDTKTGSTIFTALDNVADINNRITDINNRISAIDTRISELNSRNTEINNSLTTESLYDPRYAWLFKLVHRVNGFYTEKKREEDNEARRQSEAANNVVIDESLNNLL